jgi:esterase/lipase superfamily enzyme
MSKQLHLILNSLVALTLLFTVIGPVQGKSPSLTHYSESNNAQPLLPVFYITNRQVEAGKGDTVYGVERCENLEFGTSLQAADNSEKEQIVKSTCRDQFFADLSQAREKTGNKGVMVFVHGYDCSFSKAVKIGHKLAATSGVPVIIFSWPSRNKPLTYSADECTAEWSSAHFKEILQMLRDQVGNKQITLVAHSMGCRVISWALQTLSLGQAAYKHILFCSPDIDTGIFKTYLKTMAAASKYVGVFVSHKDARLALSRFIHGHTRLGTASNDLKTIEDIHFIDLTSIDRTIFGHAIPYEQIAGIVAAPSPLVCNPAQ